MKKKIISDFGKPNVLRMYDYFAKKIFDLSMMIRFYFIMLNLIQIRQVI